MATTILFFVFAYKTRPPPLCPSGPIGPSYLKMIGSIVSIVSIASIASSRCSIKLLRSAANDGVNARVNVLKKSV